MTSVTRLPTASESVVQLRKAGQQWAIDVVTPMPGKRLRSTLAKSRDYEAALAFAKETAEKQQRPLKLPKTGVTNAA